MRSWTCASCSEASVVTIATVRSGSTPSAGRQLDHSPAKANGSPSGRVTHQGCLGSPGRFSHS